MIEFHVHWWYFISCSGCGLTVGLVLSLIGISSAIPPTPTALSYSFCTEKKFGPISAIAHNTTNYNLLYTGTYTHGIISVNLAIPCPGLCSLNKVSLESRVPVWLTSEFYSRDKFDSQYISSSPGSKLALQSFLLLLLSQILNSNQECLIVLAPVPSQSVRQVGIAPRPAVRTNYNVNLRLTISSRDHDSYS